jgi:hypothetical protein
MNNLMMMKVELGFWSFGRPNLIKQIPTFYMSFSKELTPTFVFASTQVV